MRASAAIHTTADEIDTFLDAMFAPYPSTPRLLEAKGELRAMMEDAYADAIASGMTHNEAVGRVITDFGNLQEIAPVLGIADDLDAAMAAHVGSYRDEWAATLADPDKLARFASFVNAPDAVDDSLAYVGERGQARPATPEERSSGSVLIAGTTLEVRS